METPTSQSRSVVECSARMPDPRVNRTRDHKLVDILVIGPCSLLTVGENFTDMEFPGRTRLAWFKTFLELPHGVLSHDIFNRVFSALDPACSLECFVEWVGGVCTALTGRVVAIDGKVLRRAASRGGPLPHIVSAWATENGLALGQVKVDDKSNEFSHLLPLTDVVAVPIIVTLRWQVRNGTIRRSEHAGHHPGHRP